MRQRIGLITLVVKDYDEAIAFYTQKLGFVLREDTDLGHGKRWVRIAPPGGAPPGGAPPGASETGLLLAKAASEAQQTRCGDQTGGRVFLFLHTDDFRRDYESMKQRGVTFREAPREEPYGTVAVFEDLYGNRWDLLELTANKRS